MINLNFGLFHSGCNLSYLRYLTFKTLKHFHPHSRIQLYISKSCKKEGYRWFREKQDFESCNSKIDYVDRVKDLGVEVIHADLFPQYAPNFQSDFFRWWYLKNNGGFYMDTDQIILKPFDTLPLNHELIYSLYPSPQCRIYSPVGVIGASHGSKIVDYIMKNITKHFNPNSYNSIGPFMFREIINQVDMSNSFNAPSKYFYPLSHSDLVTSIYNGSFNISSENFALHLFLGHPVSQEFNKIYTEEFAKKSNDTVSRFLREKKLI